RLTMGGIGALIAAAIFAVFWSTGHRALTCSGSEARLSGVWDDALREKAQAAFVATGKSYAALAWEHARAQMDADAHAGVVARTDACEAAKVRGEQTEAQLQLRAACLDRRLDELQALGGAFASADVEVVDQASIAVLRLSSLEDCAHIKSLEDRQKAPPE